MDFGLRDDRWYGAFYTESLEDELEVVCGRILRDLLVDRRKGVLPRNSVYTVALIGRTITVQVFVTPGTIEAETDKDKIRERVRIIGDRYNWVGKTNPTDVRYHTKVGVSEVRTSVSNLAAGGLFG
ncbi:hypothetical protein [Saccharothrix sp. HUAS TT1]|uniref:hypothetical protein n=1 Tax=unclassified Saccharothrix TaxID=2593673 RepID=UPI00345C0145